MTKVHDSYFICFDYLRCLQIKESRNQINNAQIRIKLINAYPYSNDRRKNIKYVIA